MLLWWLGLVTLAGSGLAACPQHCSCNTDPDGYNSANCSVQALGQSQPSQIEMLSFQPRLGGYATRLEPRNFLSFQRVKFIWMVNCSVLNLPNDVFHGLIYVIRLDLSYNKIRHLNGAVFKPLVSLTTLKLRSNPLELTPWDVIVSDSLQELDLGHCGLRTLPFGTFVSMPRLSRLYLDGNELRTLHYNTLPTTLRYINLARNRIAEVPTEVLNVLGYLRKIDLSKNPVNCTCKLLIMQDWFSGQGVIFDNDVTCVEPSHYKGMSLSKINENELCTMEEVKRQRRINDIQSYRDSKSHRTHNMIHDPDFQSDQPYEQNDAEVLFHDDSGLTHMEISNKHYSVMPTDLSDENNKVAASKQDLHSTEELVPPTKTIGVEGDESSKEELQTIEALESTKDIDLLEDSLAVNQSVEASTIPHQSEHIPTPQNIENTSSEYTVTTTNIVQDTTDANSSLTSKGPHDELADEGYSPVYNMTDLMLSDGEGSGDTSVGDPLLNNTLSEEELKESTTATPESFTFPSSQSDASDYSYDSHHDYSGEVSGSTTESLSPLVEEGSGEPDNDTITSSGIPPVWTEEEENETTTDTYLIIDNTTAGYFSLSTVGSIDPSSSSETYLTEFPSNSTEESPSEASSSTDSGFPDIILNFSSSSSPEVSSTENLYTPSERPISSTSEATSSSSSFPLFPEISTAIFREEETEKEVTTLPPIIRVPVTETPVRTSLVPDVEVIKKSESDTKERLSVGPSQKERPVQSTLTYVIVGLLVALIVVVLVALVCRKVGRMRNSKKVRLRLPTDMEASPGTELQDMLLPRPAENGVKILQTNGKDKAKEMEEEKEVLSKDWEENRNEPIETVTARLSVLAGPQTPVFIHKTLA